MCAYSHVHQSLCPLKVSTRRTAILRGRRAIRADEHMQGSMDSIAPVHERKSRSVSKSIIRVGL